LSERVAKLLYAETKDKLFTKYFIERQSKKALEIHDKRIAEQKAAEEEARQAAEEARKAEEEAKMAEEQSQAETPSEDASTEETPAEENAPEETPAE
jgi:hypothetical protein